MNHKWPSNKAGKCKRPGCPRIREFFNGRPEYLGGRTVADNVAGPCEGEAPKPKAVETVTTARHAWKKGLGVSVWRECTRRGCRWHYNSARNRYAKVSGGRFGREQKRPGLCVVPA